MIDDRPGEDRKDSSAVGRAAHSALAGAIEDGCAAWDRERMLPRLLPIAPEEIADDGRAGRLAVLVRLARALRGERVRGRAGHWSYSLDRHIGLLQAFTAERRRFEALFGALHGALRHRGGPPPTTRDGRPPAGPSSDRG